MAENPLKAHSDDDLVAQAPYDDARVTSIEMTRRLKDKTEAASRSADALGKKLVWLNVLLLLATLAILGLTGVLVWIALRGGLR